MLTVESLTENYDITERLIKKIEILNKNKLLFEQRIEIKEKLLN